MLPPVSSPRLEEKADRPRKKLRRGRKHPTPEPEPAAIRRPDSPLLSRSRGTSRRSRQIYDPEDDLSAAIGVNTISAPNIITKDNRAVPAKQLSLDTLTTKDVSDPSSSDHSSTTQVFVPDVVSNHTGEVSVVIPPLNSFINPKHLAKRVIPDSQSCNDSTSTESQKYPSAPVPVSSSLPQPTQPTRDEIEAPPSSFVQESDLVAATAASQFVQEDLPPSSAVQNDQVRDPRVRSNKLTSQVEHESITEEGLLTFTVNFLPRTQFQVPKAISSQQSKQSTTAKTQEEVLSTQSGNSQVIQSIEIEEHQAVDSASKESQDTPTTADNNNLHQARRDSNDLFHSDRPPSPPLPLTKEIVTSQESTQSQEATTLLPNIATSEALPQPKATRTKAIEVGESASVSRTTKPFDSQETASQITPEKRAINNHTTSNVEPAISNIARAQLHTRAESSHKSPTSFREPSAEQAKSYIAASSQQAIVFTQVPLHSQAVSTLQPTLGNSPQQHSVHTVTSPASAEVTSHQQTILPRGNLWTTYRQSQSSSHQQPSFTPLPYSQSHLNVMSNVETSSSIPAAPSQMPDTFISQTLPARPTTPSSLESSLQHDNAFTSRAPSQALSQAPSHASSQAQSNRNTPSLSFKEKRALAHKLAQEAHPEEQVRRGSLSSPAPFQDVKFPALTNANVQAQLQGEVSSKTSKMEITASETSTISPCVSERVDRLPAAIERTTPVPSLATPPKLHPITALSARKALDLYVPVALSPELSRLYATTFDRQGALVEAFVNDKSTPAPMVSRQIQDIIKQADDACFHSDAIGDGPLTQMELDDQSQLAWDVRQSSKLAILDSLFKEARHLEKHIVLVVNSGRILTLLERFLRASRVTYSCPEEHTTHNAGTSLTVTILTSDGGSHIVSRADLIIGLDKSFGMNNPQVAQVRKQMNDDLCPTITLLVPLTIEHLTRVLSTVLTGDAYLRSLVSCAAHLRKQVGEIKFQPEDSKDTGKQLASLLTGSRTVVGGVPSVRDMPFPHTDLTPLRDLASPERQSHTVPTKRPVDDSSVQQQPTLKRIRFQESNATKDSLLPGSVSRIADSTGQPAPSTKSAGISSHDTMSDELRLELANTLTALGNQEAAFHVLQAEFQQKQTELLVARQDAVQATTALATSETKRTGLATTLTDTRGERNTLRKDLNTALKTLAESKISDVAEYGATKLQAARIEGLETRVASLQRDFDFVRQQYQNASDSASSLSNELDEAKAQIQALTAKASGSTVQLRKMFEARHLESANDEIELLRQQLTQRDRRIEQLEKDKEEMKKREESRGMARVTRSRSPAPNALQVPGIPAYGATGTASALARNAAAQVRAASARSPVRSRTGSRQTSPMKGVR